MLLYKVASFVVIDFENGFDYISFSVFDFSALKNGTEYSFVNDQFQVNDYTDISEIKKKNGISYTEIELDFFIENIKNTIDEEMLNERYYNLFTDSFIIRTQSNGAIFEARECAKKIIINLDRL